MPRKSHELVNQDKQPSTPLRQAVEYINRAATADTAGRYQEAYELYDEGVGFAWVHFRLAHGNPQARELILAKIVKYHQRAERLRKVCLGTQSLVQHYASAPASMLTQCPTATSADYQSPVSPSDWAVSLPTLKTIRRAVSAHAITSHPVDVDDPELDLATEYDLLDLGLPTIVVHIHHYSGTQAHVEFNTCHTLADLRRFVHQQWPTSANALRIVAQAGAKEEFYNNGMRLENILTRVAGGVVYVEEERSYGMMSPKWLVHQLTGRNMRIRVQCL